MTAPQRTHLFKDPYMRVLDPMKITRARIYKRWSQKDVATLCGVTQQAVAAIESGSVRSIKPEFGLALTVELDLDMEDVFADIPASLLAELSTSPGTAVTP